MTRISGETSDASRRQARFQQDIKVAMEHELAWLLRWALSRLVRKREGTGETLHGVLEWEIYEEWRGRERGALDLATRSDLKGDVMIALL